MQRHAHPELHAFGPRFALERALRVKCCSQRLGCGMKRRAKRVATGLEDVAIVIVDALAQQRIVASERRAHRTGVRFP